MEKHKLNLDFTQKSTVLNDFIWSALFMEAHVYFQIIWASRLRPEADTVRREADVLLNENKRNLIVGDIFLKILDQMKSFRAKSTYYTVTKVSLHFMIEEFEGEKRVLEKPSPSTHENLDILPVVHRLESVRAPAQQRLDAHVLLTLPQAIFEQNVNNSCYASNTLVYVIR
ncbi:MAG: hypothetical protein AAF849_15250 [Bacteroidota bacterium]